MDDITQLHILLRVYRADSLRWINNAHRYGGSFVKAFASTCLNADDDNFCLLYSALVALRAKYPKYEDLNG